MMRCRPATASSYLKGMEKCLLNRLPSIGLYKGAWTSGTLRREDLSA